MNHINNKARILTLIREAEEQFAGCGKEFTDIEDYVAEYLTANGVIVPPCKVGDMVWFKFYGEIDSAVVYSCTGKVTDKGFVITDANAKAFDGLEVHFDINCLGKTIFLSREEAEAALKGADNGKAD